MKYSEILTVNEEIVIISTETQPLGDNRVKHYKLTEREASPSFKPVKLPIDLKNKELAGTVGNHFHGDMVLER